MEHKCRTPRCIVVWCLWAFINQVATDGGRGWKFPKICQSPKTSIQYPKKFPFKVISIWDILWKIFFGKKCPTLYLLYISIIGIFIGRYEKCHIGILSVLADKKNWVYRSYTAKITQKWLDGLWIFPWLNFPDVQMIFRRNHTYNLFEL